MKNKLLIIMMLVLTICVSTVSVTSMAFAESTTQGDAFSSDPTKIHTVDENQGWSNSTRW